MALNRRVVSIVVVLFAILIALFFILGRNSDMSDSGNRPRAEIVEWIEKNFSHDAHKRASLLRKVEVYQQIVIRNREDALILVKYLDMALNCVFFAFADDHSRFDGLNVNEYVEMRYFNSFARARKYAGFNGALSGKVFSSNDLDSWDPRCDSPFWPY